MPSNPPHTPAPHLKETDPGTRPWPTRLNVGQAASYGLLADELGIGPVGVITVALAVVVGPAVVGEKPQIFDAGHVDGHLLGGLAIFHEAAVVELGAVAPH